MTDSTAPSRIMASRRASEIEPSASLTLEANARAMKAQGLKVISFGLGEPDFATPRGIKRAVVGALDANATHYTNVGGEPALKKAIAERIAETCGIPLTERHVIATSGAKEALYLVFQALCNPGEEVIIPAPYWVSYAEQVKLAGAIPVVIQTDPSNWKLEPAVLAAHLTARTRALILCSPSNPTGIVYSDSELAGLADVIRGTSVAVIVDEIYARISYAPVGKWLRVAPDLVEQTFIVDGVSKTYAMTGWRLGWLVGPVSLIAAVSAIQSHLSSHPSSVAQRAALFALGSDPSVEADVEAMVRTFQERRDAITAGLSRIPGVRCPTPDGAFYVYPDIRALLGRPLGKSGRVCQSSAELASYLLETALVSAVPGEAFGTPGFMRLSYALGLDELNEGVARLARALILDAQADGSP